MYNVPGLWNAADQMFPIVAEDLELCRNEATTAHRCPEILCLKKLAISQLFI